MRQDPAPARIAKSGLSPEDEAEVDSDATMRAKEEDLDYAAGGAIREKLHAAVQRARSIASNRIKLTLNHTRTHPPIPKMSASYGEMLKTMKGFEISTAVRDLLGPSGHWVQKWGQLDRFQYRRVEEEKKRADKAEEKAVVESN